MAWKGSGVQFPSASRNPYDVGVCGLKCARAEPGRAAADLLHESVGMDARSSTRLPWDGRPARQSSKRFSGIVYAVPDSPPGGDLVLPLLELVAVDDARTERTSQRMLASVASPGVIRDPFPRCPGVVRCRGADLFPSLCHFARAEPTIPAAWTRRRRYAIYPLRHRVSPARNGDSVAASSDWCA